jgi:signal peptidase II
MTWIEPLLAGTIAFVADQLTKRYVLAQQHFARTGGNRSFISIRCRINQRPVLVPLSAPWMVVAWILCTVFALVLLTQEPLARSPLGATGIGMALGGISGNFADIMNRRGIVDFIAIGPWPVFNIADAAIVCGFCLVLLAVASIV